MAADVVPVTLQTPFPPMCAFEDVSNLHLGPRDTLQSSLRPGGFERGRVLYFDSFVGFSLCRHCVGFLCWRAVHLHVLHSQYTFSCPSRNRPFRCISSKSSGHCGLNIDFPRPQPRHDSLSYRLLASKPPRHQSGSPTPPPPPPLLRCHPPQSTKKPTDVTMPIPSSPPKLAQKKSTKNHPQRDLDPPIEKPKDGSPERCIKKTTPLTKYGSQISSGAEHHIDSDSRP